MDAVDGTGSILDAALAIARKKESLLEKLRSALSRGDDKEALHWARKLCGMADEHQSSGAQRRVKRVRKSKVVTTPIVRSE